VLRTEPWITWSLCEAAPFAQLRTETDWQAFCRSLRGRTTTKPDYLWRRMTRAGDAAVHIVAHGDSRCAAYIDWMLQHKQQWAQRHGIDTPWFFAPHSRQFLVATLAEQGAVQPFRLVVVSLDGAPVAMALVALSATCMHLVINAFDARYAKLSPGVVLMDYCIKWAFELRLDVDFSAGEQHYKDYWTRGASYRAHSLQVACSVWGLLGSWAKQGATQARERLALALSRRGGIAGWQDVIASADAPLTRLEK
jgi:CelD/BcsL family acetyltransferase involved in cellulose biosynthesis